MMQRQKIKVIFVWFQGSVIALFPEIPWWNGSEAEDPSYCVAHMLNGNLEAMHVGQALGFRAAEMPKFTQVATPTQYAEKSAELEREGYEVEVIPPERERWELYNIRRRAILRRRDGPLNTYVFTPHVVADGRETVLTCVTRAASWFDAQRQVIAELKRQQTQEISLGIHADPSPWLAQAIQAVQEMWGPRAFLGWPNSNPTEVWWDTTYTDEAPPLKYQINDKVYAFDRKGVISKIGSGPIYLVEFENEECNWYIDDELIKDGE